YVASSVIACAATAGAHVLQWPTPRIAAWPRARISSHVFGSSTRYTLEIGLKTVVTSGMCWPNHARICFNKRAGASKPEAARYTVRPFSVGSRGARGLAAIFGG